MIILHCILIGIRNISGKSCRENQNIFYVRYVFSEPYAVYERMWKNMVEPDRPQMTIK
jgi:hypothetical protein